MKKEKILVNIENLDFIDKYKEIGINNFLFAIEDFSIGYKTFNIDDLINLRCNKFLLLNRILNCNEVDELKKLIDKIKLFDGIIFEDLSIYNIFKGYDIKLIWNQTHFATNYNSINFWLDRVDSVVISNELTISELIEILNNTNNRLVLNVFGKNPVMYSRRTLLSNFNKNFNLDNYDNVILSEPITNNEFNAIENKFGSILFNNTFFNIIPFLNEIDDNIIKYYLIYPHGLNSDEILEYLKGERDNTNDGFLNKKTIYKLGERI